MNYMMEIQTFLDDITAHQPILDKFQDDEYKQNFYAALCNNIWIKGTLQLIMTWRYAAAIVADIIHQGDYIDWYCSGMGRTNDLYVQEGTITHEILEDMLTLGWHPLPR